MPRKKKAEVFDINTPEGIAEWASSDPATRWANQIASGEIVAGQLMKMAANRHLCDMNRKDLRWDRDKAAEALKFFPRVLTVTAGAAAGQRFHLPGYLGFVVGSLFGWYTDSGRLRFRECWLELGKGMVKTPLSAAIGLYILGWRKIPRSEIYAIAKDRNQANVLFQDAVNLCRAPVPDEGNVSLESYGAVVIRGTGEMAWMIEHPKSRSKFRALANDERISGPKPAMVAADEIHEWRTGSQIELWKAALVKMPTDALFMLTTNTPAAEQVMATEMSDFYQGILRGTFNDDSVFALIARVDEDDDPMSDETCWPKALPLLGVTYPIENVRNAVSSSKHRIATSLMTKRLYFGIPVGSSDYWIDLESWEQVQGSVKEDSMRGKPCCLALDLSQKNDLTALTAVWIDGAKRRSKTWYWRPSYNVADAAREDAAQYVEWAAGGHLTLTPGRAIEYEFVAKQVQRLCVEHEVMALAFDAAHIGEFRKACDRIGFATWVWKEGEPRGEGLKMIIHAQGRAGMHSTKMLWMPRSLQQLEDAILRGEIIVDRSPLTNWCSTNAAIEADAQNNRWLVRKRVRGRIDGVVSLAMAVGLSMTQLETKKAPEYQMFVMG